MAIKAGDRMPSGTLKTMTKDGPKDVKTDDLFKGKNGQIVSIGYFSPPSEITNYDPLDVSGGNILLQWQRTLAGASDIQVQAYYDRTHFIGPHLGETRNTFDVDFIHRLAPARRHSLTWGLGARRSPSHTIETVWVLFQYRRAQESVDEVRSMSWRCLLRILAHRTAGKCDQRQTQSRHQNYK